MDTALLLQGTDEWRQARCGSLGASRIAAATARIKTGWGASRRNLLAELLVERLTGRPAEHYVNAAMQWGTDTEPQARAEYEFQKDVEVVPVGLIRHPAIKGAHASHDGLVGPDGLVEFKCPLTATHLETLLSDEAPSEYFKQMQWQMACLPERQWCDFVSFDPRLPQKLRMFCKRVPRAPEIIELMEAQVRDFLQELENQILDLTARYGVQVAA